jgi:hypothetical protein
MGLFTLMVFMFALNTTLALPHAREHRRQMGAFAQDLRAGLPVSALADRHTDFLFPWPPDDPDRGVVASGLRMLRRAGVKQFQRMPDDPAVEEVPLALEPESVRDLAWDPEQAAGRVTGERPRVVFALPNPRMVWAIRLRCSVAPEGSGYPPSRFRLFWKRSGQEAFPPDQSRLIRMPGPDPEKSTITVWIYDTIDRIGLEPEGGAPCSFTLAEAVLLVPAAESQAAAGP